MFSCIKLIKLLTAANNAALIAAACCRQLCLNNCSKNIKSIKLQFVTLQSMQPDRLKPYRYIL